MHAPSASNPRRSRLWLTVLAAVLLVSTAAQADKKVATPEEMLTAAGIRLVADDLIQALRHDDPVVREMAAKVIGTRRLQQAVPALKEQLTDIYVFARVAAAEALLRLADKSGLELLQKELENGTTPVSVAAAQGLLAGGSTGGYVVLERRLRGAEPDWRNRVLIVRGIPAFRPTSVGEANVRDLLIAALQKDAAPEVRRAAADELTQFKGPEVTAAFTSAVSVEPDAVVRGVAQAYLSPRKRGA